MLKATLDINGREIGTVEIVQCKNLGGTRRLYSFKVFEAGGPQANMGSLEHDRNDGAFVLLRHALERAGFGNDPAL